MSEYIHKRHNVTTLLYHWVFPAKYRRAVFDEAVDKALRDVCLELEKRYQLKFLEIGTDEDHVHFLVQSVPSYSVTKLVTLINPSLTSTKKHIYESIYYRVLVFCVINLRVIYSLTDQFFGSTGSRVNL